MRSRVTGSLFIVAILALCLATEAAAQGKSPRLTADGAVIVPITGVTSTGGAFKGLFALQRFASGADGGIVAVGAISGTVTAATGDVVGTVLTGPVSLPVADPRLPRLPRTGWTPGRSHQKAAWNDAPTPAIDIILVQETCSVLNLSLGAIDLNVLGLVVHTDPIALQISGDAAGPLGAAICLVLNAVGSIVNLLNTILGLLGGLTGGLGA